MSVPVPLQAVPTATTTTTNTAAPLEFTPQPPEGSSTNAIPWQQPPAAPKILPPELFCCPLKQGILAMATVDAVISFTVMIVFLVIIEGDSNKSALAKNSAWFAHLLVGVITYLLFFLLSILLLVFGALNKNTVVCWIWIVGDALVLTAYTVAYFISVFHKKVYMASLTLSVVFFLLAFLYKMYESAAVFYFIFEEPQPVSLPPPRPVASMYMNNGAAAVVPVVYSPYGRVAQTPYR